MKKLCLLLSLLGTLGAMDPLRFGSITNNQNDSNFQIGVTIKGGQPDFTYRLENSSSVLIEEIVSSDRTVSFTPIDNPTENATYIVRVNGAALGINNFFQVNPIGQPTVSTVEVVQNNTSLEIFNGILKIVTQNAPPNSFINIVGDDFPLTNGEVTIGGLGFTSSTTFVIGLLDEARNTLWSGSIFIINNPLKFILATTPDNGPSANSPGSGSIVVTASGGVAPYLYQLNTNEGQTSEEFTGLTEGTYTVSVTDSSQTVDESGQLVPDSQTVSIEEVIIALGLKITSITTTPDDGTGNGTVTVTIETGEVAQTPFTYNLVGVDRQFNETTEANTFTFEDVPAGDYFVSVEDNAFPPLKTPEQMVTVRGKVTSPIGEFIQNKYCL